MRRHFLSLNAKSQTINRAIGKLLRHHRRQSGLTQQDLADRTGLSVRTISRYENGGPVPTLSRLTDILLQLEITPISFYSRLIETNFSLFFQDSNPDHNGD